MSPGVLGGSKMIFRPDISCLHSSIYKREFTQSELVSNLPRDIQCNTTKHLQTNHYPQWRYEKREKSLTTFILKFSF